MLVKRANRSPQDEPVVLQLCALPVPHTRIIVWNRLGTSAVRIAK
jgi:hypothetical protein